VTITQLIQNSPANTNELFAKLAATSSGAVKTRESLFSQLKAELELQARLEEDHLLPVLKKHAETKELARAAVNDNKQTRALLAELDGMAKEGDDFLTKLAELRKAFQQHVRDEKKELLPAIKAALSAEETQAIAEKVEADKAEVEAAKRQEAEERRAAAREEREKAEERQARAEARAQQAREEEKRRQAELRAEERRAREEERLQRAEAEAEERRAREVVVELARTGQSLVTGAQSVVESSGAVAQAGAEAALRNTQQATDAMSLALEQTGTLVAHAVQSYSERVWPAVETLDALAGLPPVATAAAAETGKAWFELIGRAAESHERRSRHLRRSFTPMQVMDAQSRYVGETTRAWFDAQARMLDISFGAYQRLMPRTQPDKAGRATSA